MIVMLADTAVDSLLTAVQAGSRWGYSLLLQSLLIFVVYVVQELPARLGTSPGKKHGD